MVFSVEFEATVMLNSNVPLFALWCLLLSGVMLAEANRPPLAAKPLDIHVQADGFGMASAADITAVLQSAGSELWQHCPRTELSGIDIYHRNDHPQTNFKRTPSGRIAIGLASHDTYWAQYSFQFAHEFCHALANFSNHPRRLTRYPRNANLWLEESFCETASLFTLRAMSRSWRTAPPSPGWRGYASSLSAYLDKRLSLPEHHLPAGTPFSFWFHNNQYLMRQNPALRDRNTIVAIQFLPLFEAEPRGWEALAFLNRGPHNANQLLAQHFAEWRSCCPTDLRPFVARLAAVLAVKL